MSAAVVYRMRDAQGDLLYVGCSTQLPGRLQTHAREKGWWDDIARIDVEHFDSHAEAVAAEVLAIAAEQPLHNTHFKNLVNPDEVATLRGVRCARRVERQVA